MNVYERVKQLAARRKISIAQLERDLDLSNGSLSKWATAKPNSEPLEKVAGYFDVSTDYLLGRTERMDPWPASTPEEDFDEFLTDEEQIKKALSSVMSYSGEPVTDNDREILKGIIEGYLRNKK